MDKTKARIVKALLTAGAPASLILKAKMGKYNDIKYPDAIKTLITDADRAGLNDIVQRATRGEFDTTDQELHESLEHSLDDLKSIDPHKS